MSDRPNLIDDGWELASAVERNTRDASFRIPDEEERRTVRVECERMWVTISEARRGRYEGELESSPVTSNVLGPGDTIAFTADHIATVLIPVTDPRHPHYKPAT